MKKYLIIYADRQHGRFFTTDDYLHDHDEIVIESDVPQKIKAQGFRVDKLDEHIRVHLHKHLKEVGQKAFEYIRPEIWKIDGVLVGGHKELHNTIIKFLPHELARNVLSTFVADSDMTLDELTYKALETLNAQKPLRKTGALRF